MSSPTDGPREPLPPIWRGPSPGILGALLLAEGMLGERDHRHEAERLRPIKPDACAWRCHCLVCFGRTAVLFTRPEEEGAYSDGTLRCDSDLCWARRGGDARAGKTDDTEAALVTFATDKGWVTPGTNPERAAEVAREHGAAELFRRLPPAIDARLPQTEIAAAARAALGRVPGLQRRGRSFVLDGRELTRPEFGVLVSEILDVRRGDRRIAVPGPVIVLLVGNPDPIAGVPVLDDLRDSGADVERATALLGDALAACTIHLGHAPTAAELFNDERERVTQALGLLGRPATARTLGYALRDRFESIAHTVSGATWRVPAGR